MLRKLYEKTMQHAAHPRATRYLAAVSFIESSIFPIPPDVMLIPMVLANRARAWFYAAICTIASVLGGLAGYAIGYFLFETIGTPILEFYGKMETFYKFQNLYHDYGWWIVFGAGLTPFPYKVITIASGVVGLNPVLFLLASITGRAARFYMVSALLWKWGEKIRTLIEKYLGLLTILFFVLLLGGFYALKFL